VSPRLFVSTTGTDSDWVVKLIDVYPPDRSAPEAKADGGDPWAPPVPLAGYQQLVRGWPLRGKFRRSFERPEPFEPGVVDELTFEMPDVNHVFRRGHRVMVQVQSTWFPLIDRNPQSFVHIPDAEAVDFKRATQRVLRSRTQPSGVVLNVLPNP
jgi:predicted acyl esterase